MSERGIRTIYTTNGTNVEGIRKMISEIERHYREPSNVLINTEFIQFVITTPISMVTDEYQSIPLRTIRLFMLKNENLLKMYYQSVRNCLVTGAYHCGTSDNLGILRVSVLSHNASPRLRMVDGQLNENQGGNGTLTTLFKIQPEHPMLPVDQLSDRFRDLVDISHTKYIPYLQQLLVTLEFPNTKNNNRFGNIRHFSDVIEKNMHHIEGYIATLDTFSLLNAALVPIAPILVNGKTNVHVMRLSVMMGQTLVNKISAMTHKVCVNDK